MPLAPLALEAAVVLFRARVQAVRPDRDYAWSDVAAICAQVDCLPLAIELAAIHVKVLALPLLRERLTNRLTLLREGAQDLPERQRTMLSAIAWSYDLLTAAQQRCFRALGVFLGGWMLSVAESVCWQEGLLARDEFHSGDYDIGWIDRLYAAGDHLPDGKPAPALVAAAITAYDEEVSVAIRAFGASASRGRPDVESAIGRTVALSYQGESYDVSVRRLGPSAHRL